MTARDRLVVTIVLFAALVAAAWFLVLSPQRDEASSLAGQVTAQRQERDAALADLQAGLSAKESYPRDYATVARLGTAVPADDNVASLLVQLQHTADLSDVDFRVLKLGAASGAAVPAPAPPVTGAPATQATTATLPPGAAVGTAGFPTMPFAFTFTGDFFKLSNFVGRLEDYLVVRNRSLAVSGRFMTVDGIAFTAGPGGFPSIKTSIAATTYIVPQMQGLTNGATPSGPATPDASSTGQTASTGTSIPSATATPVTP
jgi:hypothetical protein